MLNKLWIKVTTVKKERKNVKDIKSKLNEKMKWELEMKDGKSSKKVREKIDLILRAAFMR